MVERIFEIEGPVELFTIIYLISYFPAHLDISHNVYEESNLLACLEVPCYLAGAWP